MPASPFAAAAARSHAPVLRWFAQRARDLPWRAPRGTPWRVLVSEVMLQQTPVARVVPVFDEWLARWPTPAALAAAAPGDAVRAWGRLGYPRRALRLHAAAVACVERFGGEVPRAYAELRSLPGVGDYTASAVASFAFGARHAVLDTNVRRVLGRLLAGEEPAAGRAPTAAERLRADAALPADAASAALWGAAVMELGALVCTARSPRCAECPVVASCRWEAAGRPARLELHRRTQPYAGTDRQARGRLLAVLRDTPGDVDADHLVGAWPEPAQRRRALDGLLADGLAVRVGDGYGLPR